MLNIFFVRHGATEDSKIKRYSEGKTPLNKEGIIQAEQLAEQFIKIGPERIYTSPYKRALKTAKIIQRRCGGQLEIIEELREVDHGLWEGYTVKEVKSLWPKEYTKRGKLPKTVPTPSGETIEQLQNRSLGALKKILKLNDGYQGNILVVTHGGVIHTVWMYLENIDLNNFWQFTQKNRIDSGDVYFIKDAKKMFKKTELNKPQFKKYESIY